VDTLAFAYFVIISQQAKKGNTVPGRQNARLYGTAPLREILSAFPPESIFDNSVRNPVIFDRFAL